MSAPGSPGLTVQRTGPQLLVQDQGRPGWAHLGIPPSGALDPAALALANRLVGNLDGAAGLEVLLGGMSLVMHRSVRVAVTGAQQRLFVDGRARPWGEPVSVRAGSLVELRSASGALRSWLAISGGLQLPFTMGSASTDTFTGLGPAPLTANDVLGVGTSTGLSTCAAGEAVPRSAGPGPQVLHVHVGPRADWFSDESVAGMLHAEHVVSADCDRVGVQLQTVGGPALHRSVAGELPSEGVVTGAVQVPTRGHPLIFLADHPVTGGYPVVAVVDPSDLPRCAQLGPGQRVRFVEIQALDR